MGIHYGSLGASNTVQSRYAGGIKDSQEAFTGAMDTLKSLVPDEGQAQAMDIVRTAFNAHAGKPRVVDGTIVRDFKMREFTDEIIGKLFEKNLVDVIAHKAAVEDLAQVLEEAVRLTLRPVQKSVYLNPKNPLMLADTAVFDPGLVARQLLDMPQFINNTDTELLMMMARVGREGGIEQAVEGSKVLQQVLKRQGYDPMMYINRPRR